MQSQCGEAGRFVTVIDLNVRVIGQDTRVWRLFPGSACRFLDSFRTQGIGFLDLPGLTLPDHPSDLEELLPRVLASADLKARLSKPLDARPTIHDWNLFTAKRRTRHRGRLIRAVSRPSDSVQILKTLVEQGLIYRTKRGRYCFAVPLPSEFINRQAPATTSS
jgi:hypothetical protein